MTTKPDLYCTIDELDDIELLPFGWVMLRRQSKKYPDLIDIKFLGGLDPLERIEQLESIASELAGVRDDLSTFVSKFDLGELSEKDIADYVDYFRKKLLDNLSPEAKEYGR